MILFTAANSSVHPRGKIVPVLVYIMVSTKLRILSNHIYEYDVRMVNLLYHGTAP